MSKKTLNTRERQWAYLNDVHCVHLFLLLMTHNIKIYYVKITKI